MSGGLTSATNNMFNTLGNIPQSFTKGLAQGTNIRVANDQNKRSQRSSDFKELKALMEIHSPKIKGLLSTNPDKAQTYVEKLKVANPKLVERLGLETFEAAMEKKGNVKWRLTKKVDESVRQDFKDRTGGEYPGQDGDDLVMTISNGDYTYETPKISNDPRNKDFSPTNVISLLNKIMDSNFLGSDDVGTGIKELRKTLKQLKPDSIWLKSGKLDDIGSSYVDDPATTQDPKEAKKELGLFQGFFKKGDSPNTALSKARGGQISSFSKLKGSGPKSPSKAIPFESFQSNPQKGVPVTFPNGQTYHWSGGDFDNKENWSLIK